MNLRSSHSEFIDIVGQTADKFFSSENILHPAIRISHPIKGRIPEAWENLQIHCLKRRKQFT